MKSCAMFFRTMAALALSTVDFMLFPRNLSMAWLMAASSSRRLCSECSADQICSFSAFFWYLPHGDDARTHSPRRVNPRHL